MSLKQLQLLLVLVTSCAISIQGDDCTVTIQNGTVLGTKTDTLDPSRKVCSYMGIPYASPPVGSLRFKPPQPAAAWDTINATSPPNWCPQADTPPPGTIKSEDCLYLNVYHPEVDNIANANLPVMIWFHGGGFTNGNTLHYYKPTRLLSRGDIVLVVVHYRLGMLGFLSTGDDISPGNYGLKDQAFAIKWVNENINAFGGNSEKVTIFGESAGGASVIYQMLSPLNKGLIHGVIAQSGTVLTSLDSNPLESAKIMAGRLNCPTTSSSAIVDCIRTKSWEEVILKQTEYAGEHAINMTTAYETISPVVEPNLPGAFITKEPVEIMKTGDIDNIPVMLGANKHDGSAIVALLYLTRIGPLKLDENPEYMRNDLVPELVSYMGIKGDGGNRAVASTVELTYLSGVNRTSWNASVPGLVDMMTVFPFRAAIQETADLLSRRGLKVYLYSFEHHSLNTVWSIYFGSINIPVEHGIAHGDELIYLFDFPSDFSQRDQAFSEKFCDMWINFGSSGNPTPSPSDTLDQWPTYDTITESYMKLNITPTAKSEYRSSWRPNGFEWN